MGNVTMKMRPFSRDDFETYRSWYTDPELNHQLGPMAMGDVWLEYVLQESPPKEFSFFENGALVAVIGIESPEAGRSTHYITAIAVDPANKRKGIGRRALAILIDEHSQNIEPPTKWVAWVDESNGIARSFFTELNWVQADERDSDDMLKFSLEM